MGEREHETDAVIIGGGLAGLSAARRLQQAKVPFVLLEASDRVGGRVRTEHANGFTFDHGFQVLLTAYPACRQLLDYDALQLREFEPGALLQMGQERKLLSDPWRRPASILSTLLNPAGTLSDKLRVGKLRRELRGVSLNEIYQRPEQTTGERLREAGFSETFINAFWRPFLGGIFLESELTTSSRFFEFVFKMFSEGKAALPAAGMEAIPKQLAAGLPEGAVRLRSTASEIVGDRVRLAELQSFRARKGIIVATESSAAARLLGGAWKSESASRDWRSVATLYFAADASPLASKHLLLAAANRDGSSASSPQINNLTVLSDIAPEYAPTGQALISVSVLDPPQDGLQLEIPVREQLTAWFGETAGQWRFLRTIHVPYALPATPPGAMNPIIKSCRLSENYYLCGDHHETPSIQGALNSGLRAAEELIHAPASST